jgi:hypothetical protein
MNAEISAFVPRQVQLSYSSHHDQLRQLFSGCLLVSRSQPLAVTTDEGRRAPNHRRERSATTGAILRSFIGEHSRIAVKHRHLEIAQPVTLDNAIFIGDSLYYFRIVIDSFRSYIQAVRRQPILEYLRVSGLPCIPQFVLVFYQLSLDLLFA